MIPWTRKNYSHSYYQGCRRGEDDTLCFETGYFGLEIHKKDLTSLPFKVFGNVTTDQPTGNDLSYTQCLKDENRARMDDLVKENLTIELQFINKEHNSKTYRVVSGSEKPRLWEAGKICQHYDFRGLKFDQSGLEDMLHCVLNIVVWPDSITFAIDIRFDDQGGVPQPLKEGIRVKMAFKNWSVEKSVAVPKDFYANDHDNRDNHPGKKKYSVTLSCDLNEQRKNMSHPKNGGVRIGVQINPPLPNHFKTGFNERFGCFLLHRGRDELYRFFRDGYRDIREYDDFKIIVTNSSKDDAYVPALLVVNPLANPTGVCPQICDEIGRPTGIPIQLNKNWHNKKLMGNYGRFYCLLPVKAMQTKIFRIRVVYGFYGSLPSASHANLCLVGYGRHGTRWEQLAIGTWGETYCMDVDMGCCGNIITDLRLLMTKGVDGKEWMWSDAGWGGDWLKLFSPDEEKKGRYFPYQWKYAYNSHGPCLTDVQYAGFFGPKVVSVNATVRTVRCDDYARTFSRLSYSFKETVPFSKASFFELGTTVYIVTPTVAFGNCSGLIEEMDVPLELKHGEYFLENKTLEGEGPWWFGFPKQQQLNDKTWGKGWRGLIIRSFNGFLGGKEYHNPSFSLVNFRRRPHGHPNLTFVLTPPHDVTSFEVGDHVSFEVEVVTFPSKSADYYGPNEKFRQHLEAHPDSWKTVHREAEGNNIDVKMYSGGSLESKYPIIVLSDGSSSENIEFEVTGGLGAVPIRFDGMKKSSGYALKRIVNGGGDDNLDTMSVRKEQEVHGSDYYQVEFDATTYTYSLAFNIVLDELATSRWILTEESN